MMQSVVFCLILGTATAQNPVEKVLTLIGSLQDKVLKDGETEQKQYEEFATWCKDTAVSTQYQIKDGKSSVEGLKAAIEKLSSDIDSASSRVQELAATIATNEKDLKAAEDIRSKEHSDFVKADADLADTIDMLGRAIGIISKNMHGASFAQVSSKFQDMTEALSVILQGSVFSTQDKDKLQALIQSSQPEDDMLSRSAPEAAAYENHSGDILTTLEDMKQKAAGMRNEAQKAEMTAQHNFEMLKQSLEDRLKVDNKEMAGTKKFQQAASEAKATAEGDLSVAEAALSEAQTKLGDLSTDCQQKAADWEASQKSRAEELGALAQAKKVISEMTGGATSKAYALLQTEDGDASADAGIEHVVSVLKSAGFHANDVALTQLAENVKVAAAMNSGDVFAKVRGMIEQMLEKLIADAKQDASHKAYCDEEMGESKAKIDDHTSTIDDLSAKIDKADATITKLTDSIATLEQELGDLVKQQATMDQLRAEQKAAFQEAQTDYKDGIEGLTMALKILRDYYASNEAESEEAALLQQPAVGVHSKAGGEATGIIGLLEVAQSDFSKLLAEAEVEEDSAQSQYEKITQENQVAKAMKEQDVKYQTKEKANLEKAVADLQNDRQSEQAELEAVNEYYERLKPACIEQPETYEEKKRRREAEISGLKQALQILAEESSTSFLAVRSVRRHA